MKRVLLMLTLSAGLATAEHSQVFDFGQSTLTTEGAINLSGAGSGTMDTVVGGYTFTTTGGAATTLPASQEANWKNPFQGTLPEGIASTMADGILNQGDNIVYTLTLTGLEKGTYTISGMGAFHGTAHSDSFGDSNDFISSTLKITLTGATAPVTYTADVYNGTAWVDGGATVDGTGLTMSLVNAGEKGYTFDISGIEVEEGGTLTLTITGTHSSVYARMPLNTVKVTVPEPATAALSLLALAGLTSRRRRH